MTRRRLTTAIALTVILLALASTAGLACAARRPMTLGLHDARLSECPRSPNCVSSQSDREDDEHFVEALKITGDPARAWILACEAARTLPGATVVEERPGYLWIECRSRVFGFVDDLELALAADGTRIEVRSASRVGWSDFGVNRKRVEALRESLRPRLEQGR